MKQIFLHEPSFFGKELSYLKDCIKSGWVSTGGGYVSRLEKKINEYTNAKYSVVLNSGTSALDLSLKAISVKPNDEIIVPTITFISPVNTVLYNRCSPIFMDVDKYGNLNIENVIEFLKKNTIKKGFLTINKATKKTIKAIIIVHVFGNVVDLTKLKKICQKMNIKIIEDASESFGSFFFSKNNTKLHTGTIGDIGCFSFNANKIITSGSGGAIVTNSKKYHKYINYLATQSKNDPIYFVHNEIGYNMKMSNISAAVAYGQIETLNKIKKAKKSIFNFYKKKINECKFFELLEPTHYSHSNYWINLLSVKPDIDEKLLRYIINFFFEHNIQVRPIWKPNHQQRHLKNFQKFKLFNYKKFVSKTICLPSGHNLSKKSLIKVVDTVKILERDRYFISQINKYKK